MSHSTIFIASHRYGDFEQVNGATANALMDALEAADRLVEAQERQLKKAKQDRLDWCFGGMFIGVLIGAFCIFIGGQA